MDAWASAAFTLLDTEPPAESAMINFSSLTYAMRDGKAYITLNRPEALNAINDEIPGEIRAAVDEANADDGAI